jgi:radical SAM superfamily enzyme YgiQ (UPF0313 family)
LLLLVNVNRMTPPIAPVGMEYAAIAATAAGLEVQIADLCLAANPAARLDAALDANPELIAISLRNVDDCFWPSAAWFLPDLQRWIDQIRRKCRAPICLGGVGFSIFAREIVERTGVEFGIRGDGEQALVALVEELRGPRRFDRVDGLVWRHDGRLSANRPAWPDAWSNPTPRNLVDNREYFRRGGHRSVSKPNVVATVAAPIAPTPWPRATACAPGSQSPSPMKSSRSSTRKSMFCIFATVNSIFPAAMHWPFARN